MNFCHQCGTRLESEIRFCPECGSDIAAFQTVAENKTQTASQAEIIHKPEPRHVPPRRTAGLPTQGKGMKPWIWIVLIVIGVGALGAAGWFAYNKYFASSRETPVETLLNPADSEKGNINNTAEDNKVSAPPKAPVNVQTQAKPKPAAKTEAVVNKQKAKPETKEQSEPAKQDAPQAKQAKPDAIVKESPAATAKGSKPKVLIEVGRSKTPKDKNPKNPVKLTINKPTMIVRITTDHYNGGQGTSSAGTLSIKDGENNIIGSFRSVGIAGKDGIPNAKWVAEPNKVLEKGTYYISDSDVSTWSKTPAGGGFIIVEGYEIK